MQITHPRRQARSFLLFGLPRVRVRADVIEFLPIALPEASQAAPASDPAASPDGP